MSSQAAVVGFGGPSEDEQPAGAVTVDISPENENATQPASGVPQRDQGAVDNDIVFKDEQPAGAVATDISPKNENTTQPASGIPHRDPGAVAIDIPSEDEPLGAVATNILSEDEQPPGAVAIDIPSEDELIGAVATDIPSEDKQPPGAVATDIPSEDELIGAVATDIPSEAEQPPGAVATDIPSEDEPLGAVAADIPSEDEQAVEPAPGYQGNSIWFKLKTGAIEAAEVLPDLYRYGRALGDLWDDPSWRNALHSIIQLVFLADKIRRKTGEIRNITAGCLQFELCCFTQEIFLETLRDYESGKIKERLEEEFVKIGIKTKGLEVKIQNSEEVERTKTAIEKRYARIP